MLLRRHNLNLLPVLRELLRSRSVARTAQAVGLSQSAVSAALARLRETFDDELLVMVGRRLELTERGRALIEPTERACLEIEDLLRPALFDPATETRSFTISTADYVSYLLAPRIVDDFAAQAPNASVHFIDITGDLSAGLRHGAFDVLAIPADTAGPLQAQAHAQPLFSDRIVVIASRRRRSFEGPLTREIYEKSRHAMFRLSGGAGASHEERLLRRARVRHRDIVLVEQFLTLPAIVEESDCLALVQSRLAERFQKNHAIEIHAPPFEVTPLVITAYWSRAQHRDPAHAWFRALLARAGAALGN